MGQSVGLLLGVAGAVVGGVLGGPLGAQAGFLAGNLIGTLLMPHKQPELADIRVQDAAYGKYIPRLYGKYRLSGNVIWVGPAHEHSQSGKGMGGKGNQPYVTMSLAVALCAGPITAVTRIWANGKLIYDITNPSNFQAISGSAQMVTNFTVYPGDENQTADPIMQSYLGAANVPAHRGMAYVVFNELNLQNWGNYLPSLSFEVVKSGVPTYVKSGAQVPNSPAMVPALIGSASRSVGSYIDNSGTVWGWQYGLTSPSLTSNTAQPFKMTPNGTEWTAPPVNVGASFPVPLGHCQDDQGMLFTDGLFRKNNGEVWSIGMSLGLITSPTYIKAGGKVFVTNQVGNSVGPVYIITPVLSGSPTPPTIVTGPYTGDSISLLGVTANYIYGVSIYGANQYCLLRLDMLGNLVSVLDGPSFSKYSSLSCGQVVNDNLIYFNAQNGHVWQWTPTAGAVDTGMPGSNSGNQSLLNVISPGNIVFFSDFAFGTTFGAQVLNPNASDLSLSSVVASECQYAGLQSSQYDVSQLTDTMLGYAITSNASARDALSPLMSAYFFDACDTGGPLKFVRRGGAPVMTIPWDDLGADPDGRSQAAQNPLVETITQEFELPRQVTLSYASANTDYNPGAQREPMPQTTSNLDEAVNVPLVLADNDAKVRVQTMLWERWIKRQSFQFAVQMKYLALEPGDVVSTTNPQTGATYSLRITKISADGKNTLSITGDPSVPQIYPNPATYVAQGGVSSGFTQQSVPYNGSTILRLLDVPPLRDQDTSTALYLAACGFNSSWPGAAVDISRDDVNFSQITSVTGQAVIGQTTSALGGYAGGNFPDEGNALTVQLYNTSQTLSSVPYASFLNGANAALVGSELIFFRTATQTGAGAYTLTGLVRGVKGTGAAIGNHTSGETFVLLDATKLVQVAINITDIGQPLYFEPFLLNIFGNTPGSVTQVTPVRARVKPLAPHLLAAGKGSASGAAGDVTLKWIRRARVGTSWVSGTDVPLDESAETYNVTVLNAVGATVRQLTVSGPFTAPAQPTWAYTAAQIAADGFTTGNAITFQVYQNSDQGVPGYVSTTTITL
ncbi:TPA: phage tail protein [Burkholderia cenocepacia]|uniref:phage tail protein n=1 Tax=Burkholderia cenocepacia TaxID=95486 RepID=UPI002AB6DA93|nr:phage tail protein [Burkholderia cenocepacia]